MKEMKTLIVIAGAFLLFCSLAFFSVVTLHMLELSAIQRHELATLCIKSGGMWHGDNQTCEPKENK